MKNTTITNITIAAAAVFSAGVLAGCEYCQPLLLATVVYLVIDRALPSNGRIGHNKYFVS
ncbi:MAG: hypothetical protein PVF35_03660 [Gammaproteobacteria bacterium]|jgi:hypothetical protein